MISLQCLCEVTGYWQELEHAVIYTDPEHPKHAQWVTCTVSITHTMPYTLSTICPVQWKPGFIREENTSPNCQTASNVSTTSYDDELQSSRDPEETTTVCAEILWLCKPIVAAAVRAAGLRWSWRWRCWMWRSWAGVVTRGLRLWGRLDVLPNSLKRLWRRLMVEKWIFNSRQQFWWIFLQSACQLHTPSKLAASVALCCVIKLHILEWPFIVASLRHICAIIMLSNQHLDMPHLWWYIEKVSDLWVQLMVNWTFSQVSLKISLVVFFSWVLGFLE